MRVLIADDEWLVAAALRKQVEAHGYDVVGTVGNGAAALEACLSHRPDLVLMDVQMPRMDGIAATRALMASHPTCVVIVTGKARLEAAAQEAGAMGYVTKPLLACQIPRVLDKAQRRFACFLKVLEESADPECAVLAWRSILEMTQKLSYHDGISEGQAFAGLQKQAAMSGITLYEAAQQNNGNGRH